MVTSRARRGATLTCGGVWTWRTATALERPARYAGQAVLTQAEATAFAEEFDARFKANPPLNSELNLELWLDHGTTLTEDHRTSLIIDPPDGRIPRKQGRGGPGRQFANFFGRPESHEDRIAQERCIMYTTAPVNPQFNSNLLQMFQTPDTRLGPERALSSEHFVCDHRE